MYEFKRFTIHKFRTTKIKIYEQNKEKCVDVLKKEKRKKDKKR